MCQEREPRPSIEEGLKNIIALGEDANDRDIAAIAEECGLSAVRGYRLVGEGQPQVKCCYCNKLHPTWHSLSFNRDLLDGALTKLMNIGAIAGYQLYT